MAEKDVAALSGLVSQHEAALLTTWVRKQLEARVASVGPDERKTS